MDNLSSNEAVSGPQLN